MAGLSRSLEYHPGDRVRLLETSSSVWNEVYAGKEATVRRVEAHGVVVGPAMKPDGLHWPAPHGFFWFREVELVARGGERSTSRVPRRR